MLHPEIGLEIFRLEHSMREREAERRALINASAVRRRSHIPLLRRSRNDGAAVPCSSE